MCVCDKTVSMQGFWQANACLPCFSGQNLSHLSHNFVHLSVLLSTLSPLVISLHLSLLDVLLCIISFVLAHLFWILFCDFIARSINTPVSPSASIQFNSKGLYWHGKQLLLCSTCTYLLITS